MQQLRNPTIKSNKLNYEQAVYCVGNYAEIFDTRFGEKRRSLMNTIDKGSPMIYSIPLGDVVGANDGIEVIEEMDDDSFLNRVKSR